MIILDHNTPFGYKPMYKQRRPKRSISVLDNMFHWILWSIIQVLLFIWFYEYLSSFDRSNDFERFKYALLWTLVSDIIAFFASAYIVKKLYERRGISGKSPKDRVKIQIKYIFKYVIYIVIKTIIIVWSLVSLLSDNLNGDYLSFFIAWLVSIILAKLLAWGITEALF